MTVSRYRRRLRSRNGRLAGSAVAAGLAMAALSSQHHGAPASAAADAAGASQKSASSSSVATGQRMAAAYGWTGGQWSCLDALWTRESGWNPYAANPTSDARGIPQDINGWTDFVHWRVPVALDAAVLLTSELITNAIGAAPSGDVTLSVRCVRRRLCVEVHDTALSLPSTAAAPADPEASRGPNARQGALGSMGLLPHPVGKAVYCTLAFPPRT